MSNLVFITDGMLEGLLKWLRFLGFNTVRKNEINKERTDLKSKNYLFLTTSRKNWEKWDLTPKLLLKNDNPDLQLRELNEVLGIFKFINFLSRCSVCNIPLKKLEKEQVKNRVPENIFQHFSSFYYCPHCQRIYWEGGHIKRLIDKLSRMGVPISKRKESSK